MMRFALMIVVVLAGCKGISLVGSATGRLKSTGATGTWVFEKGPCYSGDRKGFYGVTVESAADVDDGVSIRIVKDPISDAWSIRPNMADTCRKGSTHCEALIFNKDDCKKLDVKLKLDPSMKTKYFSGTIDVDCSYKTSHVFGSLKLDNCRGY
jgi:hypothetical protein